MKEKLTQQDIFAKYQEIMSKEIGLRSEHRAKLASFLADGCGDVTKCTEEIYDIVWRIFETARSSTVSRSYNVSYNLTKLDYTLESVGAHTNLVTEIATEALDFHYGGFSRTCDGYTYRDVIEAVRLHDLPENEMGDLADNGSRDESEKHFHELKYLRAYLDTYPNHVRVVKKNAWKLLDNMEKQDSPTGKLIYLSDKIAALLVTLCLDSLDLSPIILEDSPYASDRDRQEMAMCDFGSNLHAHRASEMWAVDFFVMRNLVRFDEDFFFTAILVMGTLMVNGIWYSWREKMYQN